MFTFFLFIFLTSVIVTSVPVFGLAGDVANYISLSMLFLLSILFGKLRLVRSFRRRRAIYILSGIGIFVFPLVSSLNFVNFDLNGVTQSLFGLFIILFCFLFSGDILYKIFRYFVAGKIIGVSIVSLLTALKFNEGHWLYIPNIFFCVSYFLWLFNSTHRRSVRTLSFFMFILFTTLAYFYGSRGDLYIVVAIILYVGLYKFTMVRLALWLFPVFIALGSSLYFLITFPTPFPISLTNSRGWTIGQRVNLWSTGLVMTRDSFPLGLGPKSYDKNFRRYWLPRTELKPFTYDLSNIHSPHNQIILSLVEGGILGVTSLIFLFGVISIRSTNKRIQLLQVLLLSFWSALGADWLYGPDIVSICLMLGVYYRGTYNQAPKEVILENSSRYKLFTNRRGGKTTYINC